MSNTLKGQFRASAGFSESKNQFIPYENLEVGKMYAFTFNPQDQPCHEHPIGVSNWFDNQRDFFKELKYCHVRMYCEVSTTGRFHFHGFLWLKDKLRYTIYDIPKIVAKGSSKVDTMATADDYITWLIYCNKQQNEMNDYLTSHLYCQVDPKLVKRYPEDGVIQIST